MEMSQVADEGKRSKSDEEREQENAEKGKMGEATFTDYLNGHRIPFIYAHQSKESYSEMLREQKVHRPDYIVYTKKGLLYIDVKFRTKRLYGPKDEGKSRFILDQFQISTLLNLQNEMGTTVWLAFTNDSDVSSFLFASISEIHEYFRILSEHIKEKYPNECKEFYEEYWIYIPEKLLYDCFPFENVIDKKLDFDFEMEAQYHVELAKEGMKDPKAVKGARINRYKRRKS